MGQPRWRLDKSLVAIFDGSLRTTTNDFSASHNPDRPSGADHSGASGAGARRRKPRVGGYQLFQPPASEQQADIQLVSLENFGNFTAITAAIGNSSTSVIVNFVNGVVKKGVQCRDVISNGRKRSHKSGSTV